MNDATVAVEGGGDGAATPVENVAKPLPQIDDARDAILWVMQPLWEQIPDGIGYGPFETRLLDSISGGLHCRSADRYVWAKSLLGKAVDSNLWELHLAIRWCFNTAGTRIQSLAVIPFVKCCWPGWTFEGFTTNRKVSGGTGANSYTHFVQGKFSLVCSAPWIPCVQERNPYIQLTVYADGSIVVDRESW